MPNTAKQTGGTVPISPITQAGTAKSRATWSRIGESEATPDRSEKARRTMPMRARVLPRQSGREEGLTRTSLGALTVSWRCGRRLACEHRPACGRQDSCEPSTQARYSSDTVPVM